MNNSSSFKFILVSLFVLLVFTLQVRAQIGPIFERMEAHRKALQTLRANIKWGKYNKQTDTWDVSEGKVILIAKSNSIKSAFLRMDLTTPRAQTISVVDGKFIAYKPK